MSDDQLVPSVGSYDAITSGDASLALFHSLDSDQIHGYGTLDVKVMGGELFEGDVIEIYLGLEEGTAAGRPLTVPLSRLRCGFLSILMKPSEASLSSRRSA